MRLLRNLTTAQRFVAAGLLTALVFVAVSPQEALAAARGEEFNDVYNLVKDWATGSLGKVISLAFLLVGLAIGVLRGSILAAVSMLAASIALLLGPEIIDALFGATGG